MDDDAVIECMQPQNVYDPAREVLLASRSVISGDKIMIKIEVLDK